MSLSTTIVEGIKSAMKAGDKLRLETLRSLRARILEYEKSGAEGPMDEKVEQDLLLKEAKKRKDAIEQYNIAGRDELAAKEQAELEIINEFLPKQLDDAEITARVRQIMEKTGASGPADFGKVMGAAMGALRGQADGARVQAIVKELLN